MYVWAISHLASVQSFGGTEEYLENCSLVGYPLWFLFAMVESTFYPELRHFAPFTPDFVHRGSQDRGRIR